VSNYIERITPELIKVNENGRIFKPWTEDEKNTSNYIKNKLEILDILGTYDFDFFPKLLAWDEKGYSYEYVEGEALRDYILEENPRHMELNVKFIYELKIAMDKIHEELYHASMEIWNGKQWLYHRDLWLGNLVWNHDLKELKIIDVDSIEIVQVPHICNGINFWLLQLEQIFIERKLNGYRARL
jgi:hypothetical protein